MTSIYKIMEVGDWAAAKREGKVLPAPIDLKDGFIHLSAEDQALETAALHFAGRTSLVAVAFDARELGDRLKWERSRGGALFPHYYGELSIAKAARVRTLQPEGRVFRFGEDLE